jgi:hypothetical protein
MTRTTYYVSPSDGRWKVTKEGRLTLGTYATKDEATRAARIVAEANRPSQVVVQRQDGRFQTEWTYGADPYPPRG